MNFKKIFYSFMSADKILKKLEDLNYFKFTLPENLNEAKEQMKFSFIKNKILDTEIEDYVSLDGRIFQMDYESLTEGGVSCAIGYLEDILKKEGVIITELSADEYDEEDNYYIILNEQKYIMSYSSDSYDKTLENFYNLINNLLEKAGSKERLFFQEENRFIFLTDEIFDFFKQIDLDKNWMPSKQ